MHQSQDVHLMTQMNPAGEAAISSTEMRPSDSRTSDQTIESTSSASTVDLDLTGRNDGAPATRASDRSAFKRTASFIYRHSNFYRIHLVCFTLIPLIFACIFWAIDKNDTSFVDALFICVSSMTVTGLNPLLMEEIRGSQQALSFILLFIGSTTGPSLITLMIRRYYFGKRFSKLMKTDPAIRKRVQDLEEQEARKNGTGHKIRPDMIKRVDEPIPLEQLLTPGQIDSKPNATPTAEPETVVDGNTQLRSRRASDPAPPHYKQGDNAKTFGRTPTMEPPRSIMLRIAARRAQTIGIQEPVAPERELRKSHTTAVAGGATDGLRKRAPVLAGPSLHRTPARRQSTGNAEPFEHVLSDDAMGTGYGGFPNPIKAIASAVHRRIVQGQTSNGFDRTVTLQSVHSRGGLSNVAGGETRAVSYISFDAAVSGNSQFHDLTAEQKEELGGIEYRAISLLTKVVATYWILVQFIPVLIVAPIFASGKYSWIFSEGQGTVTNKAGWYAVFNLCSCYANAGISLLDESMGLFTDSYGYVLVSAFLILAGNTAFPVFLRFVIWTMYKLVPSGSRTKETLQFLLDHPRRCFIYLFPSHQTWLLLLLITLFTSTDWVAFLVLDIGNPVVWGLSPAARAIDSLFQSISVRTAGFSITTLSALAPAVLVLYIVMMYLAIYPLALSVRTTNVYEEQAMGILPAEKDDPNEIEERFNKSRRAGGYFAYHARKQLAFDVWWLGLALWAVCIVERDGIQDGERPWLNVFSILFECTSAYGTVGLSLGVPYAAFSLVGDMKTLSKLIIIAVMIRGRHRALPLAIDRSIMLPSDSDMGMTTRASTQSSHRSDRSITHDGHVMPNLGKTQAAVVRSHGRHASTFNTGESTAVASGAPGHTAVA